MFVSIYVWNWYWDGTPSEVVRFLKCRRRLPTSLRPRSSRLSTPRRWTPTTTSRYIMFHSTHIARQCLEIRLYMMHLWVMRHLSLQSGGPTASGDSDKSKSEVNDEDEEVRESKSSWVLTLAFHCWFCFVHPKPHWHRPFETGFAGWRVMDDGWRELSPAQVLAVSREILIVVGLTGLLLLLLASGSCLSVFLDAVD